MERIAEGSRRPWGRITGAVYLLYFLTAIFGEVISRRHVIYGDAVNLISDALYVAVTVLLYLMFKPVNRSLSLVAAVFSLAGCAVTILDVFYRAPSHISPLLFFGPYCLLLGYLIFRSTFLPRFLGVLMALAGVGWLIFLSPLVKYLSTYLEVLGIVAEGALMPVAGRDGRERSAMGGKGEGSRGTANIARHYFSRKKLILMPC